MTKTLLLLLVALTSCVLAYPPAPHHEVFGTIRNEQGTPISSGATVAFYKLVPDDMGGFTQGPLIVSGNTSNTLTPGTNYSVKVPMDANLFGELFTEEALVTSGTFTAIVQVAGITYVPIEVSGVAQVIGEPAGRTRLNLTLGVDSDGDGLPDAWEETLIAQVNGLNDLADVEPNGDADNDGVSNYIEYIAGTYAFTGLARFGIEIIDTDNGFAHLRFLGVNGRTYQLKSSTDMVNFTTESFITTLTNTNLVQVYVADKISFVDLYVPISSSDKKFFVLCVE